MQHGRRMISSRLALAAALVFGITASATAQDVQYNAMPGADFAKFKTYKWVTVEGVKYPDQILDQQIRGAIDTQLTAKGMTKVDADTADLYVAYQVAVEKEQQWNAYGMSRGFRYGGGSGTMTSTTIQVGVVALDMYDPAKKELVWKGTVSKTLDSNPSPEKRTKNLDKAMSKLLKNYPPPVKK